MKDQTILVTGDYWHPDFQSFLCKLEIPVTMVPIDKVDSVNETRFDLLVIAQARRNQFSTAQIEKLQSQFVNLPMVALLGSWCEGELRSGAPWPGVTRVYWHQWQGRYEQFVNQLDQAGITDWHAPRTSSVADRVASQHVDGLSDSAAELHMGYIGISAWTHIQYEMVADAVKQFGWRSRWVERAIWDAATSRLVSAICVDANSWASDLENRLKWLREELPEAPLVLLLNYPRLDELESIHQAGVREVVSKPFELNDLKSAILRAVHGKAATESPNHASSNHASSNHTSSNHASSNHGSSDR
jgi:CheY-like chemotaxis protein